MRRIITTLAALCLSAPATAADIGRTPNKAGGWIAITDAKCPDSTDSFIAYSRTDTGNTMYGCWVLSGEMVHVFWHNGRASSYELGSFQPVQQPQKPANREVF